MMLLRSALLMEKIRLNGMSIEFYYSSSASDAGVALGVDEEHCAEFQCESKIHLKEFCFKHSIQYAVNQDLLLRIGDAEEYRRNAYLPWKNYCYPEMDRDIYFDAKFNMLMAVVADAIENHDTVPELMMILLRHLKRFVKVLLKLRSITTNIDPKQIENEFNDRRPRQYHPQ
jgi:hypothetical protein